MYEVKEGAKIHPFGPKSKLTGKVTKAVYDWAISKKIAKASDFKKVTKEAAEIDLTNSKTE